MSSAKYVVKHEDRVLGHYPGHTHFDALEKMFTKYHELNIPPFKGESVVTVGKPGEDPVSFSVTVEMDDVNEG